MIAGVVGPGGGRASLDADGELASFSLRRGNATLASLAVPGDVAAATIARLAVACGLDPLVERDSLTAPHTARLHVRVGIGTGEILVTLGTTARGMSLELHLLSFAGQAVEQRRLAQLKRCITCGAYQPTVRQRCENEGGALREVWDDPRPGGTVGIYRIHALLGQGGCGHVFAGEHALLERPVAIKVLLARLASDIAFESRFLLEARAASRLRHPNLVEVADYGVLQSGSPFLVMERLTGESLERRIGRGPLTTDLALRITRAIALGLSAAHEGGVIHNDLKPSNVILLEGTPPEDPGVKVIDFGAASLAGAKGDGVLVGTASYIAPERIDGGPSDARSDVYSLGILLYRMIRGTLPFEGSEATALFRAHLSRVPEPVTSPDGALPRRVVRLVMRALEKKPIERYQSMKEMIVDIDLALASLRGSAWQRWLP
jgi:serine/threonine protein kinase